MHNLLHLACILGLGLALVEIKYSRDMATIYHTEFTKLLRRK